MVRSNILFYVRLSMSTFDKLTGVAIRGYRRDTFHLDSIGAPVIRWDYKDPEESVRKLTANNGEGVEKLVDEAVPRSKKENSLGKAGVTDCLVGEDFHMYTHVSNAVPVPSPFRGVFGDVRTWLPFRALLSVFPPVGGEVPRVARFGQFAVDDAAAEGDHLAKEWENDRELVEYRQKRLTEDVPVSGPVALGNVFVKASRAAIRENTKYVMRYSLMSTSDVHALDGEALWIQVYDKTDHTTTFLAVGGGRNNLWGIDKLNNRTAGLVFSTMHHTFGALMASFAKNSDSLRSLTNGVTGISWSQSAHLMRENPMLGSRRDIAGGFDVFSRLVALMRRGAGMHVVDSPDGDDDLVEITVTVDDSKN
ncbi:hypothetical protein O7606_22935 [Micromonospora sp. WMMD882]|uniref:hypothetical protein n=1 Tax=Micromonospora sp. WMMD882 TaxID=3015151 RepID=UPI00248C4DF1|nr:hypothetical protein [Micromonospora sp. WMMD882]WBB79013.1 hypothetical protein O7606_22935 [Micromonospora sp. WMMD882]